MSQLLLRGSIVNPINKSAHCVLDKSMMNFYFTPGRFVRTEGFNLFNQFRYKIMRIFNLCVIFVYADIDSPVNTKMPLLAEQNYINKNLT